MKDSFKIILALAALVAVVIFLFVRSPSPPSVPDRSPQPTDLGTAGSTPRSETPSKDNVSHNYRAEVARLEQRLTASPEDTTALIDLARMLQDAHQLKEATAYYKRYVSLHPGNRQAWLDLAHCYAGLQRWNAALQTTQSLLAQVPNDPSGMYNLGAIYANLGNIDQAKTWWQKTANQQADPTMAAQASAALLKLAHPAP